MSNFVSAKSEEQNVIGLGKFVKVILISEIMGFLFCFLSSMLFSFILSKFSQVFNGVLSVCSLLSLLIGAFVSGFTAAGFKKKNGLLIGAVTGLILFLVTFFIGVLILNSSLSFFSLIKLLILVLAGSFGGVISVNRR